MRADGIALAIALAVAGATWAQVISPGPATVAVTIYSDDAIPDPAAAEWSGEGLAMVRETRTVDLPAGESRLVLEGVANGALPETAAIEGLPGRIAEQNFDYELLGPGSLIEHSLGRTVQRVRTNSRTGKSVVEDAVLRSGPDGVVLDVGGRIEALDCSGGAERLVFHDVPPELTGKAALSARVRVDRPGRYQIRLSYLTVGVAWKASYVARVAPDAASLDLTGWITLANHGDTGFANAPTSVVAGRLARQEVQRIETVLARRQASCWPMGNSHHPQGEQRYLADKREYDAVEALSAPAPPPMAGFQNVAELVVTAQRRAKQSELGDYKLYTLVEPTTVAARQTKQLVFLRQGRVTFDSVYVYKLDLPNSDDDAHGLGPTTTTLRLENKTDKGLGLALPAGAVSVRQVQLGDGGPELFVGEPSLRDIAVGAPFELEVGEASDVEVNWRVVSLQAFKSNGRDGERATIAASFTNAKPEAVTGEFRHAVNGQSFKVVAETSGHGTKGGDPVWRLTVPANGQADLTYTVRYLID